MNPQQSIILLPCHALSDFPYHHEGEAAADLLAAYTAPWHPALLAGAAHMPGWRSAYLDDVDWADKLLFLPRVCAQDLPGSWPDEARGRGALLVEAPETVSRQSLVEEAAARIGRPLPPVASSLEADFFSLGLCHLLLELLTVQMRYSSLIDEELFSRHLIAAADAAMQGDEDTAREKLAICFDALNQSRSHFYPVDCYLLDLTLVGSTTLGRSLRHELSRGVPQSLLMAGSLVEEMADREPQSVSALREALDAELACVVGGEYEELQLPLLPLERVLANLHRGLQAYQQVLGARPKIFGRRRAGLSPMLPQLLEKLNFSAALHFWLDDGHFPQGRQSLFRWEGQGATAIDALSRVPLDAARPDSILTFPQHMSTAMDMDHVAIVGFAHWPAAASVFYDDLRRSAAYGAPVGRFVTLEKLFAEAEVSGQMMRFKADEYRTPYLVQDVAAGQKDCLSIVQKAYAADAEQSAIAAISTVAAVAGSWSPAFRLPAAQQAKACIPTEQLAAVIPRSAAPAVPGLCAINSQSFSQRLVVAADELPGPPAETSTVVSARQLDGRREVLIELPPMGYAWISPSAGATWQPPSGKPMVEGLLMRNEFCEVTMSEKTGGIHCIFTSNHRHNRLSQQLALRGPGKRPASGEEWKSSEATADYSLMVADNVEVRQLGPASAQCISRGRLVDDQSTAVAEFVQRTTLSRGTPVVGLDIELKPLTELSADPWQNYLAARFAWPDETAELYRGVASFSERTEARRIESPEFVEVRSNMLRTTILSGGLPYHRRAGDRSLDTLLVVRGETCQKFRLGIALDLKHPQQAARSFFTPPTVLHLHGPSAKPPSAWLFHLDARNVIATHWEPVPSEGGAVRGVRVRLLETAGRAVHCGLHVCRPLSAVRTLDFAGGPLAELKPDGEKVMIDMAPGQWTQLELEWH